MPRWLCPLCAPERYEWAPEDAPIRDALLARPVPSIDWANVVALVLFVLALVGGLAALAVWLTY
jgi:hypothetical protein